MTIIIETHIWSVWRLWATIDRSMSRSRNQVSLEMYELKPISSVLLSFLSIWCMICMNSVKMGGINYSWSTFMYVNLSKNNEGHVKKADTAPSDTAQGHAGNSFLKSWYYLTIQEPGITIKNFHSHCQKGATNTA